MRSSRCRRPLLLLLLPVLLLLAILPHSTWPFSPETTTTRRTSSCTAPTGLGQKRQDRHHRNKQSSKPRNLLSFFDPEGTRMFSSSGAGGERDGARAAETALQQKARSASLSLLQQVSSNVLNGNAMTKNGAAEPSSPSSNASTQQQQQQQPIVVPVNSLVFEVVFERDGHVEEGADGSSNGSSGGGMYILAVLPSVDRVDLSKLQRHVMPILLNEEEADGEKKAMIERIQLAPSEKVQELCGSLPGRIPPVGLTPPPLCTLVESSLAEPGDGGNIGRDIVLLGGSISGPNRAKAESETSASLTKLQTLLHQSNVHVASFREEDGNEFDEEEEMATGNDVASSVDHHYPKPYFAVAPPPPTVTEASQCKSLQPVAFSVVGRVSGIRRMARTLAFLDLSPPTSQATVDNLGRSSQESDGSHDERDTTHPWRCGQTGDDMAVQLIAGKTFCQRFGEDADAAVAALKQIKVGQLVLVTGQTNVQNKESLKNWIKAKTLDLIVASIHILQKDDPDAAWRPIKQGSPELIAGKEEQAESELSDGSDDASSRLWGVYHGSAVPSIQRKRALPSYSNDPGMSYLSVTELYGGDLDEGEVGGETSTATSVTSSPYIRVVNSMEQVQEFQHQLSQHLLQLTTAADTNATSKIVATSEDSEEAFRSSTPSVSLVGVDCEWRPNFLAEDRNQPQPVLVLQICFHALKRAYLFDLQALLRPLLPTSEPMNDMEAAVARTIGDLWHSQRLIKVGFQLAQDMRRLAASYPHIATFQTVNSLLEASRVGKKVMYLTKQKNSRVVTSSLSRLAERVLGKTINKEQQCSDWSIRPFTEKQIEYAALDAVVTPIIVEKLRQQVEAKFYGTPAPALGRWENDSSFRDHITSWRFLFLDESAEISRSALKKLNAKRIVGNPYVVTQTWITGRETPKLPSLPAKTRDGRREGPYTDVTGTLRIPSQLISTQSNVNAFQQLLDVIVGERMGRSKDSCLKRFLHGPTALPEGATLDYPQRSGYVEFEDAVALFVNAPTLPGKSGGPRSYPNEWLDNGKVLTWFLRENDWKQGTTNLARMILPGDENSLEGIQQPTPVVVLFVRLLNGPFLCCGVCKVTTPEATETKKDGESLPSTPPRGWDLVQLNLALLDWERLQSSEDFRDLVNPSREESDDSLIGSCTA